MKGLDLRKFKKVATDGKTSTFKNDKGSEIKIAHAGLSKAHLAQMNALPLYKEEGGKIPKQNEEDQPATMAPPEENDLPIKTFESPYIKDTVAAANEDNPQGIFDQPKQSIWDKIGNAMELNRQVGISPIATSTVPSAPTQVTNALSSAGQPNEEGEEDGSPQTNLPNQGAIVTGQQTSPYPTTEQTPTEIAIGQEQAGLKAQRDVDSRLAQAYSHLDENRINSQQDLIKQFQANNTQLQKYHADFLKDFGNGAIKPNHYMESMKTGPKIASAIGLFLGGLGSAFTHQGNPALDFLNKQIDRDIEAQRAGVNNKLNLYHANLAYFRDQNTALNQTRAQMNDIYLTQMKKAADDLGTPAAQARYLQAAGLLGRQTAGELQQASIRKTINDQINKNGGYGLDPLSLVPGGYMTQDQALKEQSAVNEQRQGIQNIRNIFNQLKKEQTTENLANPQSFQRRNQLWGELTQELLKSDKTARLTPESVEQEIKPYRNSTFSNAKTWNSAQDSVLNILGRNFSGSTPVTSKYAPGAVPTYPYQEAGKLKVGNIVNNHGRKEQIIDIQGNTRPVK